MNLNQFEVSLSSVHIRGVWVFTDELFMLLSLLGLRRPFLSSGVFVAYFLSIFGSTKICFDNNNCSNKKRKIQTEE